HLRECAVLDAVEEPAGGFLADAGDELRASFRIELGGLGDVRMRGVCLPARTRVAPGVLRGRGRPLAPLLEEERRAASLTPVAQSTRPIRMHGPCAQAALAADNDPVKLCDRFVMIAIGT